MARKSKEKKRRRRFGRVFSRQSVDGAETWYAQWREHRGGPRVTRAIGSEKEASDFLDKIEAQMRLGTYGTPATVAEVEDQAEDLRPPQAPLLVEFSQAQLDGPLTVKAASTRACYAANHKALAAYFGRREIGVASGETRTVPAKRIDEITVTDAIDYRAWRRTRRFHERRRRDGTVIEPPADAPPPKPVSPSTINRDLQYLSMILGFAVRDGLLESNPLTGLRMERERSRVRRYLTKTEVTRLILACDAWLRPLVLAGLFTGARGQELKRLTWGDVDFENGKLTIYRPKVNRGDRIDLHPALLEELRRVRASRPGARPSDRIFLNRYGRPYRDTRKAWARAVKAAGLEGREGLTFHATRHTFATHFLEGGGAITDLQSQLGHSKLATTQVYAAMVNERRRSSVLALDYGALTSRANASDESNSESNSTRDAASGAAEAVGE